MKKIPLVLALLIALSSLGLHNVQAYSNTSPNKEYVATCDSDVRILFKEIILNRETRADIVVINDVMFEQGYEKGMAEFNGLRQVLDAYDYHLLDFWNIKSDGYYGIPGYTLLVYLGFRETKAETAEVEREVASVLPNIINDGMSSAQKIDAINTYICKRLDKDTTGADSAYGALTSGISNSMGYALLGKKMLDAAGFESTILKGSVGKHAWNYVYIDGQWKHVDFHWNDYDKWETGDVRNEYSLLTDEELGVTHRWDKSWKEKADAEMSKPHDSALPVYDSQWVEENRWDRVGGPPVKPAKPPVKPVEPVEPAEPPVEPVEPVEPAEPPVEPAEPPVEPVEPPVEPLEPSEIEPGSPGTPVIYINNKKVNTVDQTPVIKDGRTLVPIRLVSEALGAKVAWNNNTLAVLVTIDGKTVELVVGSRYIAIDKRIIEIDTPPTIIGNRTMVPLRVISEAFGMKVKWVGSKYAVMISTTS